MHARQLTAFIAGTLFLVTGCRTNYPPGYRFSEGDNALRVSGPPGTRFTATYQSARGSGSITSATKPGEPATVYKTPDRDLQADIRKFDASVPLTVEIARGDRAVFRADVPPGKEGVRVEPKGLNWQAEIY